MVNKGWTETGDADLRYAEFDGLRGLAAFIVFIHHAVLTLDPGPVLDSFSALPLSLLWDGVAAVDLFFVLSGFVLALPFVGGEDRHVRYLPFVVRRVFRIYPAYWFALMTALVLRYTIYDADGVSGLSDWTGLVWDRAPSNFFDHVFLIGHWAGASLLHPVTGAINEMYGLNPVIWSLVIEMRMSLIFPLAIILIRGLDTKKAGALLLALIVLVALMVPVLWALPHFVAGGLIAHFRKDIKAAIAELHGPSLAALWVGGLIFFNARYAVPGFHPHGVLAHYLSGIGATLILVLVVGGSALPVLTSRPARFLGRISYGFYLIHLPVLLTVTSLVCGWLGSGTIGLTVAFAASCALALGLSALLYRFVESPAQNLGRQISRRIAGTSPKLREARADTSGSDR